MRKPVQIFLSCTITFFFLLAGAVFAPVFAASASLELSPSTGTIEEGGTLDVDIVVDSGEAEISAVDIEMLFDPDKFSVSVDTSNSVFSTITPTSGQVDNTVGKISFSAYTEEEETVQGTNNVATLELTSLVASGEGEVTFDFTLGETNDCNVIEAESVDDILESVTDGVYTFESSSLSTEETEDTTTTDEDTEQLPETTDTPETGEGELTVFFFLLGCSLLFSGFLLVF